MKRLGRALGSALVLSACKGTVLNLGQTTGPPPAGPTPLTIIVTNEIDTGSGADGGFVEHMSTSLQPASWQYKLFQIQPDAGAYLKQINPYHLHIQALDLAFPMQQLSGSASDWDAGELDTMMPAALGVDPEAMFQIMAPPFLTGSMAFAIDNQLNQAAVDAYATYCGYLVQYFNQGGFEYPEGSSNWIMNPNRATTPPILWWSILGEFDSSSGLTGAEYATVYNAAVQSMQLANGDAGTLHFSSFEYGDPVDSPGAFENNLGGFIKGVTPWPDVVAIHLFAASTSSATDEEVFAKVPLLAGAIGDTVAGLADAGSSSQVWVTENNVNSQAPGNGTVITVDGRGTSIFFAAYRPYVFSRFGKAGNRALFHWDFTAGNIEGGPNPDMDPQNAEFDYVSGDPQVSYWVDYWLGKMFPVSDTDAALQIHVLETPSANGNTPLGPDAENIDTEVIAVSNSVDGSVVVMMVDFATESDGGSDGEARAFAVDISALGSNFASGKILKIDATTAGQIGPDGPMVAADLSDPTRVPVSLAGYGVAFLKLVRSADAGGP